MELLKQRFISNIIKEPFDYTEWQREHFADVSPDAFGNATINYCKSNPMQSEMVNVVKAGAVLVLWAKVRIIFLKFL